MKDIDKYIKDKLENAEVRPQNHVWEKIQAAQKAQARSRWRWFFIGVLSIGVLAAAYWMMTQKSNSSASTDAPASSYSPESTDRTSANVISKTSKKKDHFTQEKSHTETKPTSHTLSTSQAQSSTEKEASTPMMQESAAKNTRYGQMEKQPVSPQAQQGTEDKKSAWPESDSKSRSLASPSPSPGTAFNLPKDESNKAVDRDSEAKADKSSPATNPRKNPVASAINAASRSIDYALMAPRMHKRTTSLLEAEPVMLLPTSDDIENRFSKHISTYGLNSNCYSFLSRKPRMAVDMYGGAIIHGNASFEVNRDSDGSSLGELEQDLKEAEMIRSGYEFGMRASVLLKDKIYLRSGVAYTKVKEDFRHVEIKVVGREITGITVDTITDPNTGDTEIERDTTWVERTERTIIVGDNQYEFLDIPLEIGLLYSLNRWTVGFHGGVLFNLAFDRKGITLMEDGAEVRYDGQAIDGEKVYRDRLGMSLTGSLYAAYEIFPEVHLFAEPHMRYMLKPMNVSQRPIDKKFQLLGLRTGVSISL